MKHLQKTNTKVPIVYIASVSLLIISLIAGVLLGTSNLSAADGFIDLLSGNFNTVEARIVLYVRLPRVLSSIVCGAALAVSGAVIQGVLLNRLASPGIIGVNSGAGLAVTICSAFGILGGWKLSLFAFLGAFVSVMIICASARKWGASRGTVILMGVALNSIFSAMSECILNFVPDVSIMSNDFKVGDFSSSTYSKLIPASVMIIISLFIVYFFHNELDILSLGDDNAKGLGLNTSFVRIVLLLLSAILAGAAVSIAGLLSFVGLIVPHIVRRIASENSKHLIPICAIFGAGFVSLCDTVSRTVFTPYELPVGIIMSLIGAPAFLIILFRKKGGRIND